MPRHLNSRRGSKHHAAKLDEEKVRHMRQLHHEQGICIKCLSIFYGVRYATAWDAVNYNTWSHVR